MISLWPLGTVSWECPPPLSDGPFKLPALGPAPPSPNMPKRKAEFTHGHPHDARMAARLGRIIYSKQVHHLGSARAPGNAGYSAFQHKKRRTKSRRACAEAAPRAVATLLRPGEATVILAYHSDRLSIARDRFEVLGARGDMNKSTFGTEDKCNPLEAIIGAALRYQTLRSLTATEIGAAPRLRHVTQGVVVSDRHAAATSKGGHGERIDLTVMIQSRPRGTVTAKP